jgi:hypothetical protein
MCAGAFTDVGGMKMAYDRYDPEYRRRERGHDEDRREFRDFRDPRDRDERGGGRGFFERMGDEVRSWFGDEDERGYGRDDDHRRAMGWRSSERRDPRDRDEDFGRGYRPMTGDYSRFGSDDDRDSKWDRDPYRRTQFAGSRARSNPIIYRGKV